MSRLTRTTEPVSRDQILTRERGQGNIHFPCSADHEKDSHPYPVDHFLAIGDDHTNIHITGYTCMVEARSVIMKNTHTHPFYVSRARVYCTFLKKNLNESRPSEQPPVRVEKCQNV